MRAWELYEGEDLDRHCSTGRRPILTLRHINKLKRLKAAQRAEREQRLALWNLMYGQDNVAERRLDQREAELDAREGEVRMKELQADIERSIDDAEVDQKARQACIRWPWPLCTDGRRSNRRHKQPAKHQSPTETNTGQGSITRVTDPSAAAQVGRMDG